MGLEFFFIFLFLSPSQAPVCILEKIYCPNTKFSFNGCIKAGKHRDLSQYGNGVTTFIVYFTESLDGYAIHHNTDTVWKSSIFYFAFRGGNFYYVGLSRTRVREVCKVKFDSRYTGCSRIRLAPCASFCLCILAVYF